MAKRAAPRGPHRTVLFSVLGTSPAVLAETVWALADERPSTIPDDIVVLTTTLGAATVRNTFFGGERGGWERLKEALARRGHPIADKLRFGPSADRVRLFPSPGGGRDLDDIATSADNVAAADFLLRELRAWTEDPGTRVLASIAGGRKTMGALLMSCMGLLGREQDRVLHVLVNPPFDGPLEPLFLFPEENADHRTGRGEAVPSSAARIELIDVPFVRVRGWYAEKFRSAPPSYAALVAAVQSEAPPAVPAPALEFDFASGELRADKQRVELSATEFSVLALLCKGEYRHKELARQVATLAAAADARPDVEWLQRLRDGGRFRDADEEGVSKTLSSARQKLRVHPLLAPFADRLVPRRGRPVAFPARRIAFLRAEALADIRG